MGGISGIDLTYPGEFVDGRYQIAGNIDQRHGGIQIVMDGGRNWHIRDYTDKWQFIYVDTETVGCDPSEESPVDRARLYCWSVSYFPTVLDWGMRGQPLCSRVFFFGKPTGLSREMLEDTSIGSGNHQCHYDAHVFRNEGIIYKPCLDSLRLSRQLQPQEKLHGLEKLMAEMLGYSFNIEGKGGKFTKLFSKPKIGVSGKVLKSREAIPLDQIHPYTPLFCRLVDYSTLDTKGGLEVTFLLLKKILRLNRYRLPDYLYETYREPGWVNLLRQLIGAS